MCASYAASGWSGSAWVSDDGLGEVLGQVPDRPVRILRRCDHALDVDLGAEPDHVRRLRVGVVELGERLVPGLQREAGVRVAVALGLGVPHRGAVHVDRAFVRWPPQRVVGGLDDLAQDLPGDRAAHRDVEVRRQPELFLDGGEVLHLEPRTAAQVLDEPVERLRAVQRVQRRAPVVVRRGVDRAAGPGDGLALPRGDDLAVGGQGEGDEHRRPVGRAVRGGEGAAHGAVLDRDLGQVGHLRAPPRGPDPTSRLLPSSVVVVVVLVVRRRGRPGRRRVRRGGSPPRGASPPRTAASAAAAPSSRTAGTGTPAWTRTG